VEVASSTLVTCLTIAFVFYVFNASGIIAGILAPPPGFEPLFTNRTADYAQYETWVQAYRRGGMFITNYHAPWLTEPALFNAFAFIVGRFGAGAGQLIASELLRLLAYLLCGYGWYRCLMVFGENRSERNAAIVIALCSVPVLSLFAAPMAIATSDTVPGFGAFLFLAYDGFLHALPGNVPTTIGTALTLLSFALVGEYLRDGNPRRVIAAVVLNGVSAFLHPFEFVLVTAACGAVLLFSRHLSKAIALGLAAAIGLAPYVWATVTTDWVRDASRLTNFDIPDPVRLVASLGIPTLVGLLLVLRRPPSVKNDRLLSAWVLLTLVLLYVPGVPHPQHLLDGYHVAVGLWVVSLARGHPLWEDVRNRFGTRTMRMAAIVTVGLSLLVYPTYWAGAFMAGNEVSPRRYPSTVRSTNERLLIEWLRQNASPDDLILAPPGTAGWVATVPMHSVASHWLFSLTYEEQLDFARSLFAGQLTADVARKTLDEWGVRFIVVPENQSLEVPGFSPRETVGGWRVLENPTNRMRDYGDPTRSTRSTASASTR
jgi:hypothetical protein